MTRLVAAARLDQPPGQAPEDDETIAALGLGRFISGREPLLLNDPAMAIFVRSGEIDLFLVEIQDGEPSGARHFLRSFAAGELLFGIDCSHLLIEVGLLAVGTVGTEIAETAVAALAAWADSPPRRAVLGGLLEGWILAISEAGSQPLHPHPHIELVLAPGQSAVAAAHQRLSVGQGVGWVSADRGELLLFDIQDLAGESPDAPVPLCAASWLATSSEAELRCEATATLLEDGRIWRGLAVFHNAFLEAVPLILRLAAVDEANRMRERSAADINLKDAGTAALAATARTRETLQGASAGASPLFKACDAVARAAGLSLRPPGLSETASGVPSLDLILRANRLRRRQVALEGDWWRFDVGSVLVVQPDGTPAAVLRRGRSYVLYDPVQESSEPLSAPRARLLRGTGFVFYEPLPDEALSPYRMFRRAFVKARSDIAVIIGFGVLGGLLAAFTPMTTATMIDVIIPGSDRPGLLEMSAVLIGVALVQLLLQFTIQRASLRFVGAASARLQTAIVDRLLRLPARFFRRFTAGDLMIRVLAVQQIESALTGAVIASLISAFFTVVSIALMIVYAPLLGAIATGLIVALAVATFLLGLRRLGFERASVHLRGRLSHKLHELAGGIAKFRLSAAEERVYGRWAIDQAALARSSLAARRIEQTSAVIADAFLPLAQAVVFAAVVYLALTENGLGLGTLIAFLAAFGQAMTGAIRLAETAQDLMSLQPAIDNARPILEAVPEAPQTQLDPGELSGAIEISHVDFRYTPDGPLVLQDLSLQVAPGEYVALVGPSGCGKSTVLRLLLGFEEPESGAVLFDGHDLRGIDVAAVRRQIGVVLQDGQLFAGSLLDNILGAHGHLPEAAAWQAAEAAGLADDIRALPMRMQTICGAGVGLSGGQVQRVAIARALVHRPRFLLFDEATSALDNRTQAIVTASLGRLRATRIVIAHRLSTVMAADRIVVMRDGAIIESGHFDELIRQGGFFAAFAARQTIR
jgi:NHLM bacteriocin system ABC transporter ATP-binding protein